MFSYLYHFVPNLFSSSEKKVEEHIVFTFIAIVGFLVLGWWDLAHNAGAHFDAQGYGVGMGGLLAGSGAASWGKSKMMQAQGGNDAQPS